MSLEDELTQAFIDGYKQAGKEVGYWGRRFLQAVKRNGGLATAKRMLLPRNQGQRKGLDALLEANRPELSVEAIVLQPRFRSLFTDVELTAAKERLGEYGKAIVTIASERQRFYPDELEPGHKYAEGAKKQIRVNAYERNPKARAACLKHHGYDCVVCGFNFQSRYGPLGKEFILQNLNNLLVAGTIGGDNAVAVYSNGIAKKICYLSARLLNMEAAHEVIRL